MGIESSCDDTSAAVLKNDGDRLIVLSNVIANQDVHRQYGGVVPELASRAHQQNIVPVVQSALAEAGIDKHDIDAVAVTIGPGLLGSLMVGSSFAKGFCASLNIPMYGVNHMQGHILAHFISDEKEQSLVPEFPFLCLTVSGGHTQLVLVKDHLQMEIIGQTIDDAAGEAFDKAAKIFGLDYPGGPLVDKLADAGNPMAFPFARPTTDKFNYSFSGLKTSILYFVKKQVKNNPNFIKENLNDLCASVRHTIVSILLDKMKLAIKNTNVRHIALAGGVSANSLLRKEFNNLGASLDVKPHIPPFAYCTDNAAMIASAGYFQLKSGQPTSLDLVPQARMSI